MAKSRDKGKREVKKKKKEKAPKGVPPPFSSTTFTPRREPGMPGSAGAPPEASVRQRAPVRGCCSWFRRCRAGRAVLARSWDDWGGLRGGGACARRGGRGSC